MTIKIVGLVGEPGTGKDTIADFAIQDFDVRKVSFAAKIYSAVSALNPIVSLGLKPEGNGQYVPQMMRVNDLVSERGWRAAKDDVPEVRQLLQRMGTEVGRQLFGESFWINLALNTMISYYTGSGAELNKFVFTDLRFENEEDGLRTFADDNLGDLLIIRVRRPGYEVVNGHASELSYDDIRCDVEINNDGNLTALRENVQSVLGNFFNKDN